MKLNVRDITAFLEKEKYKYEYQGKDDFEIVSFCQLSNLKHNSITWIKKIEEFDLQLINKNMNLLIVANSTVDNDISGYNIICCDNPKEIFFSILNKFFAKPDEPFIATTAVVETDKIGKNVAIGHHCYVAKDVTIGNNVVIRNNVSIECKAEIGDRTIINSGVVIGTDGFGYYKTESGTNIKVTHFGGVKIGKDVEIGANTCIDRGTLGDTIIEDNVKIDNLCHIAHNVHIGARTYVIALSMIAGSCKIEEDVHIAPGAMIMNQLTVGKNSLVGMGAVVTKNVETNKVVAGVPAKIIRDNI